MRVGQRLYLALLPAVLGVLTVAALAYWGQYAHARRPEVVVVVAVIARSARSRSRGATRATSRNRIEQPRGRRAGAAVGRARAAGG